MTATLTRPESVKTSWPKLSALYLEECASKFIFKSRCSLDTIWCNLVQFENIVCKMTVTLPGPECVNILWTILSVVVSIWQNTLPNHFPNLGAM